MHTIPLPIASATLPAENVEDLFILIQDLAAIMVEENVLLAAGLPAAVVETTDRKVALAERFDHLWSSARGRLAADQKSVRRLIAAIAELRHVADENLTRLDAARAASQRRVETAMAALRGKVGTGYSCTGTADLAARMPLYTTTLRA